MPRVKIEYVVSFSSEDPEHPASNLLLREVSKKKWLCRKGESTCSVVLQLPRAVQISAVHIGAYHAALVEVLAGRAETANEPFQVLVPSSVFVSREESRRPAAVQRVRSFSELQLSTARLQRWDRLRLVCSQPYNKHCQFGLSFVHVDECEGSAPAAPPARPRLLPLDSLSSDEDEFRPGELFAQHRARAPPAPPAPPASSDTGAQIRQATSQVLKNIPEFSTKLMKAHISKPNLKRDDTLPSEPNVHRNRDSLLYAHDDRSPPARSARGDRSSPVRSSRGDRSSPVRPSRGDRSSPERSARGDRSSPERSARGDRSSPVRSARGDRSSPVRSSRGDRSSPARNAKDGFDGRCITTNNQVKKRRRSSSQEQKGADAAPHRLLAGAQLVLSGYLHPRRAALCRTARALGARLRPAWGPGCTHLICAFPSTPKLRALRAGGGREPAVRAEWLEQCSRRRRLLPWTWFATEPEHRTEPTPEDLLDEEPFPKTRRTHDEADSADDTDEEIEKVLQDQKRRFVRPKPIKEISKRDDSDVLTDTHTTRRTDDASRDVSTDDEIEPELRDVSTDEEGSPAPAPALGGALPDVFDGYSFVICASPRSSARMQRYVRALGGLARRGAEPGAAPDYVVRGRGGAEPECAGAGAAARVSAGWLARCVAAGALLPHS